MKRALAVLLILVSTAPAAAQAPTAAESAAPAGPALLRPGPDLPSTATTPARPAPWSLRPGPTRPDPALISPGLQSPAAPRLEGSRIEPVGGSACRTACAANLYQCQAGEGGDHCDRSWSACVLACPTVSGAL